MWVNQLDTAFSISQPLYFLYTLAHEELQTLEGFTDWRELGSGLLPEGGASRPLLLKNHHFS
jgi:hypothetical protein